MTEPKSTVLKKGKATGLSHDIAETLARLRADRGMTQRDFAAHLGISFQQYQKYEKAKDRISLEKVILLCREICIPLDAFSGTAAAGFAEDGQAVFDAPSPMTAEEMQLLDLFRGLPKKAQKNLLATAQGLGTIKQDKK